MNVRKTSGSSCSIGGVQRRAHPGHIVRRFRGYSGERGWRGRNWVKKLFETPTGMRNGMGPPITFAVDGKQYIALMGGSGGTASPGVGGGTATSQKPRLLVFGLDGKAELPKPATPAGAAADPHQP